MYLYQEGATGKVVAISDYYRTSPFRRISVNALTRYPGLSATILMAGNGERCSIKVMLSNAEPPLLRDLAAALAAQGFTLHHDGKADHMYRRRRNALDTTAQYRVITILDAAGDNEDYHQITDAISRTLATSGFLPVNVGMSRCGYGAFNDTFNFLRQ